MRSILRKMMSGQSNLLSQMETICGSPLNELQVHINHFWQITEVPYSKLCSSKNILTVNGQFPGPTVYVTRGDTIEIDVINNGTLNVTIHWHGVKQPRFPWSDGPEYITQCPIFSF